MRLVWAERTAELLVPVTVMGCCETGGAPTEAIIESVDEAPDNIGFGEKVAEVAAGKPETESVMFVRWPRLVLVLTLYCAVAPATTVCGGPTEIEKSSRGSPLPDNGTACGLAIPVSLNTSKADLVSPAVGVNVTSTAQFAPGTSTTPFMQLLLGPMPKSALFWPVTLMAVVIVKGTIPRFVKIIVTGELVVPTN